MEIILIILAAALLAAIGLLVILSTSLERKTGELEKIRVEKARLEIILENEKAANAEKISLFEDAEERLKQEFENLAHRIFEDRGRVLTEQNRERLSDLLQPFKEQLTSFRNRVDEIHRDDTDRSAKVLEQVRHLTDISNQVSEDANNLARAIKGDAKAQGDWGELIVERIFEASGLVRGREYDSQPALRDDDGSLMRPDFVVYLPGEKAVIVDSKVSLTAFERFWSDENPEERQLHLADHLKSVRAHIDELQQKDYSSLLGNRTLDFVVMCVPLESAYGAAVGADRNFFYDLARTGVVVTGPSTLMITLKLITQIWRRENENRNAAEIADRAGRLYDQVARIAETMLEAKRRLAGTSETFDRALKRLGEGRGNLISRVEELKQLGAKVRKAIPDELARSSEEAETEGRVSKNTETEER